MHRIVRPSVRGLLLLASALAAGCGGSSGGGSPARPLPPQIVNVTPAQGSFLGGTLVTITGAQFNPDPGATLVLFGESPAANVTVSSPSLLTCRTPGFGVPTIEDVSVVTPGGQTTVADAFAFNPPPTIATVTPSRGSVTGGLRVGITGTGFVTYQAGPVTVRFGADAASAVVVENDTSLHCETPMAMSSQVGVSVENANGVATLANAFLYLDPVLFAADGKTGMRAPGPGNLYRVDPTTAAATLVGALGVGVTGLAFSPVGTLYAAEADPGSPRRLFTVNPATAAVTPIGPLGTAQPSADLTWVASALVGIGAHGAPLAIDPLTGAATPLGPPLGTSGHGLAADRGGTVYLARGVVPGQSDFYKVDPPTGTLLFLGALTGTQGYVSAMAWLDGVLYAVDRTESGSTLGRIDLAGPAFTAIGALPQYVDAIEGSVR
jgi:hypothetical protein